MIKAEIEIVIDGQKHLVRTTQRDTINCEEHFNASVLDLRSSYLLYLAYSALKRTDKFTGTWDEFLDKDPDLDLQTVGEQAPLDLTPAPQESA